MNHLPKETHPSQKNPILTLWILFHSCSQTPKGQGGGLQGTLWPGLNENVRGSAGPCGLLGPLQGPAKMT